jgi:Putative peptidoglycan binding domain
MADNDDDNGSSNDYTVQQGDYVSKLAAERGFSDFSTIWDHPQNQELKKQRTTPNVLAPGDKLFIPDKETRTEPRATDATHEFVLSGKPLKLRIVIHDMADKPVSGKPCDLKVTGSPDVSPLSTNGTGLVEREIKPDAAAGTLKLKDDGLPINLDLELKIGDLDPLDTVTGQKARLNNLGYDAGEVNDEVTLQFKSAVEEFQCDHKPLAVDGDCGTNTQAKLKLVYGC